MTWLVWRQFRAPAAMAFAALAALVALLAVTGPGMADDYSSGLAACGGDERACDRFVREFFQDRQAAFLGLTAVMLLVPALLGLFWGAPLIARELEAGTHRLVWNQSVTRTRWLAVKLALVGLGALVVAGLAVLAVDWWAGPVDKAAVSELPRLSPMVFAVRGVVPVAYAAFAFVLGVTVGMLVRRTLPAMAITLAVFVAVQVAMPLLARPSLIPPEDVRAVVTTTNLESLMTRGPDAPIQIEAKAPSPGAWILTNETVDRSGKVVKTIPLYLGSGPCAEEPRGPGGTRAPASGPSPRCVAEIERLGYRQHLVYHPASRFWTLQWAETGVYALLTLGLTGFTFWWLRRRVS